MSMPTQNRPPAGVIRGPRVDLGGDPQPQGSQPTPNLPIDGSGIPADAKPVLSGMGMTAGSTQAPQAGDNTGGFPGPSGDVPRTTQGTVIGQTKARPRTPFRPSQHTSK